MVSLAGLWRACGVEPSVVVGHSQGEIAAACVAGGLSLDDAARVVALRGRALAGLAGMGGMVSVAAGVGVVEGLLEGFEGVSVAAVNGPSAVVVSGERGALDGFLGACGARGLRAREIPVDYAAHSVQVEGIRGELLEGCDGIAPCSGGIPFYSAVTGGLFDTAGLDGDYWYRNLRETVQFERVTRVLLGEGYRAFIEASPHPVLTGGVQDAAEAFEQEQPSSGGGGVGVFGSLRRGDGGPQRFLRSLAEAWVNGVPVDWTQTLQSDTTKHTDLPTYAFQRQRYWLGAATGGMGDLAAVGQASAGHPLLGAVVAPVAGANWLFTGRLSLDAHPWLADYVVMDKALLPGTAMLEIALHVSEQVGCGGVQELKLDAPLVIPEQGAVQLRISVEESDDLGRRAVSVHSRLEETAVDGASPGEWTCNAVGVLAPVGVEGKRTESEQSDRGPREELTFDGEWPPRDAVAVGVEDLYERFAEQEMEYGPAFRGLRAAWRHGKDVLVEVVLPEEQRGQAGLFGIHPALFDAALQGLGVGAHRYTGQGDVRLPCSWSGVELFAEGVDVLRGRLSLSDESTLSVVLADESGGLVARVRSLVMGAVSVDQLAQPGEGLRDSLFFVDWVPVEDGSISDAWAVVGTGGDLLERSGIAEAAAADGEGPGVYADLAVLGEAIDRDEVSPRTVLVDWRHGSSGWRLGSSGSPDGNQDGPGAEEEGADDLLKDLHGGMAKLLGLVQAWLADERFAASRLVLLTHDAVATGAGEQMSGLAAAPVWGLVRSAQAENPGRLMLVDIDGSQSSLRMLPTALGCDEPQLAIRDGLMSAPRLARRASHDAHGAPAAGAALWDRQLNGPPSTELEEAGTVLITGGTGGLGALVARHLVAERGVRSLVLVSRQGRAALGATELQDELEGLGARVTIAACDVTDRPELEAVIEATPEEFPLRGVVHTAGVLDDGIIGSLTEERLDAVLAPKVDAAWHLHELTRHLDLREFVMFSSAAGVLGSPGQGNYAAGNAFLDALAVYRSSQGLAGVSIAWGLWAQATGMTSGLDEDRRGRIGRTGLQGLSTEDGLGLLDAALVAGEGLVVAMHLDHRVLRVLAGAEMLPTMLRGLVRHSSRRSGGGGSLARRLMGVSEADRDRVVSELISSEVAVVLGHESSEAIDTQRAFKDLGFDSLMAVELRNRLNAVTGLRFPATLVFEYPTPTALADHVLNEAMGNQVEIGESVVAASTNEPIAIVGMSCRYPGGVESPEGLWELVVSGRDAIAGFPEDRGWDVERSSRFGVGLEYSDLAHEGGFLYDAGNFDAAFFGISPREAIAMDPQQRVLLEASWEAFEDVGFDPSSLKGSPTGVFVGLTCQPYGMDISASDGFGMTGGAPSVASGRVSYVFGFEGPAVSVDTACSSSLVALHLACGALRGGECSLALAGGVAIMSTPLVFGEFARQGGLASDGRCKSFADTADGTGWGEGVGMMVLERLSDAQRNGHRVLGLVRGSAVNQDGASNGLTAPNGISQQRVIRRALANAGLSVSEVDVVEAHGTGTTLGDPIEAQALLATYGRDREGEPLWLGSVKSNIGHTQSAAGAAGMIKMVMALRHGVLPKTLHVNEPSSQVDWTAGKVALLTKEVPWEPAERPRRAGISSFGISGTNAHVILEEAPVLNGAQASEDPVVLPESVRQPAEGVVPWVLSGRGVAALRGQAERLLELVSGEVKLDEGDVGLSLLSRSVFERRAVVLGDCREELLGGLGALAGGNSSPNTVQGVVGGGGLTFLFTGQGAQRVGMGRELYEAFPIFRDAFDGVCGYLDDPLGRSLADVVFGGEDLPVGHMAEVPGPGEGSEVSGDVGLLDETMFTQAGLFALEVALFRLAEDWGVRPDFVIGHSIGELAAAHVAGVFSIEDACRLVAARGRLMGELPAGGAMVAVQASEEEALETLEGLEERVALAAVNGPLAVVLSGDAEAVLELADVWERRGRKTKRLRVSHAFHSPRMDGMLEQFAEVAESVSYREPRIPIVSNLTGELAREGELCDAGYWVRHVREPVRFADGVRWLGDRGVRSFLELGPDGVLSAMTQDCLADTHKEQEDIGGEQISTGAVLPTAVPMLRSGRRDTNALLGALAEVWVRGAKVDWEAAFRGTVAQRVALPKYAFQRERYWLDGAEDGVVAENALGDADVGFWNAVEAGNIEALAGELGVGGADERSSLGMLLPALSAWRRRCREESVVGNWRYRVSWKPLAGASVGALSGVWLVVVPVGAVEEESVLALLGALENCGAEVERVDVETGSDLQRGVLAERLRDRFKYEQDATRGEALGELPAMASEVGVLEIGRVSGVLSLLALDDRPHPVCETVSRGLAGTMALAQSLGDASIDAPLWVATRGAVSVGKADPVRSISQGMVWGLCRTLGLEAPSRFGGVIDLPDVLDEHALNQLCGVLKASDGEDQLAVREAGVFARRVRRAAVVSPDEAGAAWKPRGTVLVTGGTGGLGVHVARWLTQAGAEHLLLVSRRGPRAPGADTLRAELEALGARVSIVACDVGDRDRLEELIASVPPELPLDGVVHAAGVVTNRAFDALTVESLAEEFAGKADAAQYLHELTEHMDLSAFVLFSSIAATFGAGAQGAYAAANSFLDSLAEHRRARGLVATCVAWGMWAGEGMGGLAGEMIERRGVLGMEPELAIAALEQAIASEEVCLSIADIDWKRYALSYTSACSRPLIEDLAEVREILREGAVVSGDGGPDRALVARLAGLSKSERERVVLQLVRAQTAGVMGLGTPEGIDAQLAFKELGFDSLMAVELRNKLRAATGLEFPSTVIFDYPTLTALSSYIAGHLGDEGEQANSSPEAELGRLAQTIVSLSDNDERTRVTASLKSLLAKLEDPESSQGAVAVAEKIHSASDEEIFGFIDETLGT
jgi:acyl transferase domain-containing protein/acyl carrier protein